MDVTHGLGDFLTLPPGLSQFQAPYTLLSSFLCSCLCTYLGSPNKFSPVVKMNPPIGGFQNQHHPPCSVLHCWSRWRRSHSLHLQAPPALCSLVLNFGALTRFPRCAVNAFDTHRVTFAFHCLPPMWLWWGLSSRLSLCSPFPLYFITSFGFSPAVPVLTLVGVNHHCAINKLTGHRDKS